MEMFDTIVCYRHNLCATIKIVIFFSLFYLEKAKVCYQIFLFKTTGNSNCAYTFCSFEKW